MTAAEAATAATAATVAATAIATRRSGRHGNPERLVIVCWMTGMIVGREIRLPGGSGCW